MSTSGEQSGGAAAIDQIRSLAAPLRSEEDIAPLVRLLGSSQVVCVGEASHGTHEYYSWRAALSRRFIEDHGFTWIGVEGDWPDCWRINQWVRGLEGRDLHARQVLSDFERWPTWMWANDDVASFLDWLRDLNSTQPEYSKVGFYGLDVYSLWDSLRRIIDWLQRHQPDAIAAAMDAWQCFVPYHEEPHRYARATRLVPASCEREVVRLLVDTTIRTAPLRVEGDEGAFDAVQNAEVAVNAERYYRTMVRGGAESWNVRDRHMADTVDRLIRHHGPGSRGLVWEHNTHVGDARATDMAGAGMINVGQLLRQRHPGAVALVGFAGHRGTVLAAPAWGEPEFAFALPDASVGSHEDLLHRALGQPALLTFGADRDGPWLGVPRGHRAVGVVYDPGREERNYVPTVMGRRYDALMWFEATTALQPLHHERRPIEPELETEPTGF